MVTAMRRAAFTLVELLVVMVVIATLAGMLFAVGNLFSERAKVSKTQAILAQVVTALETTKNSGGAVSLTEHPLAASAGAFAYNTGRGEANVPHPRASFVRHDSALGHAAIATVGEALAGVGLADLPAVMPTGGAAVGADSQESAMLGSLQPPPGDRLLLPDDHLADSDAVHLMGMQRRCLSILGGGLKNVTWYRRLPKPMKGVRAPADPNRGWYNDFESSPWPAQWTSGNLTSGKFDNALPGPVQSHVLRQEFLRPVLMDMLDSWHNVRIDLTGVGFVTPGYSLYHKIGDQMSIIYDPTKPSWYSNTTNNMPVGGTVADSKKAFEASLGPAMTEIAKMGAIYEPPTDGGADLYCHDRLWKDGTALGPNLPWRTGYYAGNGYRLRGPALYDAWGTEILVYQDEAGDYTAMSAGKDGSFRWLHGQDRAFSTVPYAFAPGEATDVSSPIVGPSGDDAWAGDDNLVVGKQ
jgi:prepilin-type N-terminal cleavage/methylation domain-containing protein